ncbi:hypothetical protein A9Q84_15950 [Halobacteriovorax marinus]|uniref:Maltoporin n=1 Tax=Halobacteriovorax marinus TaxID=97084 RepID=A0A1Y5F9I4_9BACT|nr:hypothetical protein A9Q84_15950 [Halobacteriovorax marinus]
MKSTLTFIFLLTTSLEAHALTKGDFEYKGYFRSQSATNSKGGKQECFNNAGAPGNEFRLGNECTTFTEFTLVGHHLNKMVGGSKNISSVMTFSTNPNGDTGFEATSMFLAEAYIKMDNLFEKDITYWVGRRYYREFDAHINDWKYFMKVDGLGGGVENIKLPFGKLAVAQFMETGTNTSHRGTHIMNFTDIRIKDIKLAKKFTLDIWSAYAFAPGGYSSSTQTFNANKGYMVGGTFTNTFETGDNRVTIQWGEGLVQGLGLGNGNGATDNRASRQINKSANRFRIVENLTVGITKNWETHLVAAFENWSTGEGSDADGNWYDVGIRPVYIHNDHFQLAFEAGHSSIQADAEKNYAGAKLGRRKLTRFTIAPQLAMSKGIWARPVIRAFYTKTFWNSNNTASKQAAGQTHVGGTAYESATYGSSWGLQAEVWF